MRERQDWFQFFSYIIVTMRIVFEFFFHTALANFNAKDIKNEDPRQRDLSPVDAVPKEKFTLPRYPSRDALPFLDGLFRNNLLLLCGGPLLKYGVGSFCWPLSLNLAFTNCHGNGFQAVHSCFPGSQSISLVV